MTGDAYDDIPVEHRRQVILDALAVEKADRFRAEVYAVGRPEGTDVADTANAQLDAIDARLVVLQQMLDALPAEEPSGEVGPEGMVPEPVDQLPEPTAAGLPVVDDPTGTA